MTDEQPSSARQRRCRKCQLSKPISDFVKSSKPGEHSRTCRGCFAAKSQARAARFAPHVPDTKRCRKCDETKRAMDFPADRARPDGLFPYCRVCHAGYQKTNYKNYHEVKPDESPEAKTCSGCRRYLSWQEYGPRASAPDKLEGQCRDCRRFKSRAVKYGLTVLELKAIYKSQNYSCRICGIPEEETGYGRLVIDHRHDINDVSGLLCDPCNKLLGHASDDREILRSAAQYLDHVDYIRAEHHYFKD